MNASVEIMNKWAARKRQSMIVLTIFMVMFAIAVITGASENLISIMSLAVILVLAMNIFICMSDLSMLKAVTELLSCLYAENGMLRKAVYTLRTSNFIMYKITADDVRAAVNKDLDDETAMKVAALTSARMADELSKNEWFMERLGEIIEEEHNNKALSD